MRLLYISFVSLIIALNIGLAFAFHEDSVKAPLSMFPQPQDAGSSGGYWENVPLESGYQEGQYQRRWVPVDGGGTGTFGGGGSGSFGGGGSGNFGGGGTGRFDGGGSGGFQITNPLGGIDTIQELINRLIDALIVLATPVAIIMVLWGGFLVMTSAGESARYAKGGKVILYAAVGYGILLLAKGVTAIIESVVYDII